MHEVIYIADELSGRFRETPLFDQVAALQGEPYRDMVTRRTIRFTENGKAYFAKVHFGVGWWEIFKNLLQGRLPVISAANEWHALRHLAGTGIDTLEPVLYCKSGWNPARIRSCIITRALDNTINLDDLLHKKTDDGNFSDGSKSGSNDGSKSGSNSGSNDGSKSGSNSPLTSHVTSNAKRKLIIKIAEIARGMHTQGMNHRDFYLCHLLLDQTTQQGSKLFLIDLHRAQLRRRVPARWRTKDLGGLLFSALETGLTQRDILRFIRAYLPEGTSLRASLSRDRSFWKRVQRRATKLYLQDHASMSRDIARLTGRDDPS